MLAPPLARRLVALSWVAAIVLEKFRLFNSHYLVAIQPQGGLMQATSEKTFTVSMQASSPLPRGFKRADRLARRLMDIVASFLGLLILSPFLTFIALLIKRDSPGPVFYWGRRMGMGGNEFRILKFRTMYETQASHAGPKVTAQGDARITPMGAWLRSTKLNELPQLWNVLVGEMSLVGPRPEDPDIVQKWPEDARRELLSVRPGMTSPASVVYRDEESMLGGDDIMDDYLRSILPSKLRFDQIYVRNRTLLSDLDVIFWTFILLLPRLRHEQIPEERLYWGPLSVFFAHDFRWFVVDFFVALGGVAFVGVVWRSITPLNLGWGYALGVAFLMSFIFGLFNAVRGLNRVYWEKANSSETLDLMVSSGIAIAFLWVFSHLFLRNTDVPDGLFFFGGLVTYLGFVSVRYRERLLTGMATRWLQMRKGGDLMGERVLIVGAGDLGAFATWLIRKGKLAQAFHVVGMVDDDPRKQGMRVDGIKVLGTTGDLKTLTTRYDVGIILYAISNIEVEERLRILSQCQDLPIRTVLMPNVVEMMRNEFRGGSLNHQDRDVSTLLSPSRMDTWLSLMDELLEAEAYELLHMQIEHLRTEISLGRWK